MKSSIPRWLILLCVLGSKCEILSAPEIRHFAPHGVAPGRSTVVTFSGSGLGQCSNLWTSFGGTARRLASTNGNLVSFAVTCPAEARGVHALQLIGPDGASNFQLVLIDPIQTTSHGDNHQQPSAAVRIKPPVAVDCILKSEQIDYYTFAATAGQRFSIEVIAHRIGSQMDPVVRVLNEKGQELAFCDDGGGVWKDARFEFKAPSDGEYTLAVHDIGYGGGNALDYRLRVSDDPLVWYTFPLVDPADSGAPVERIGAGVEPREIGSPLNPAPAALLSVVPQMVEAEPNDSPSGAQAGGVPVIIHGRMGSGKDADCFGFAVRKDQKLVFQSQTRSLGSPCDLVLRIKQKDGTTIAQSDLGSPGEAALTNKFSEEGLFYLEVRELSGNATPDAPYRINIREFAPGFTLSAEENIINIKPGEPAKLKISVTRFEDEGEIELRFDPPIEGIGVENATVPEKKNEVELTFRVPEDARPGAFQHVRIVGKSASHSSGVSTVPALRQAFPLMLNPPLVLDGVFTVTTRRK